MAETLYPPAITREAEDPELEQLAYEITSDLAAASVAGVSYLARKRDAGEKLVKARKRIKHGNWIAWLNRHNIKRTTAFMAIKTYSKCSGSEHLDDVLGEIAESGEEQEKLPEGESPPPEPTGPVHSKKCRLWGDSKDCEACKAQKQTTKSRSSGGLTTRSGGSGRGRFHRSNAPAPKPPREPITLEQVFEHGQACLSQARRLKAASKKVRTIERGDIYRTATGVRNERIAESLLSAAMSLMKIAFPVACLACKGNVNANRNSDPCKGCGGNGYLIGESNGTPG